MNRWWNRPALIRTPKSLCLILLVVLVELVCLIGLIGCDRIRTGKQKSPSIKPAKGELQKVKESELKTEEFTPKPQLSSKQLQPQPTETPTKTSVTSPPIPTSQQKTTAQIPSQPITTPSPSQTTISTQPITITPTPSLPSPVNLAEEGRRFQSDMETLLTRFERLSKDEIIARLLWLNQSLSELEVLLPALILWRTALRIETLSKTPLPDTDDAKLWLERARRNLQQQKRTVGLTALEKAEKAITANRWSDAISILRETANRLNAPSQVEAITSSRKGLLNSLYALEQNKPGVAKAELYETLKTLDNLLSGIP